MSYTSSSRLLAFLHQASQLCCRNYWDIALILLVAWTVVVLPIRAAFAPDYYKDLEINHNLFQQLEVGLLDFKGTVQVHHRARGLPLPDPRVLVRPVAQPLQPSRCSCCKAGTEGLSALKAGFSGCNFE